MVEYFSFFEPVSMRSIHLHLYIFLFFFLSHNTNLIAQSQYFRYGYCVNPSYSFYQRTHLPNTIVADANRSTGQILNILPDLSGGFWLGMPKKWAICVEAGISYAPFSFNLQNYQGLGQLQYPLLVRAFIPIQRQQSAVTTLNVATGVQWNRSPLYLKRTDTIDTKIFPTYLIEISTGLAAISQKSTQVRGVDLFFRFGLGTARAMSFQTGLRLNFWNSFQKESY